MGSLVSGSSHSPAFARGGRVEDKIFRKTLKGEEAVPLGEAPERSTKPSDPDRLKQEFLRQSLWPQHAQTRMTQQVTSRANRTSEIPARADPRAICSDHPCERLVDFVEHRCGALEQLASPASHDWINRRVAPLDFCSVRHGRDYHSPKVLRSTRNSDQRGRRGQEPLFREARLNEKDYCLCH